MMCKVCRRGMCVLARVREDRVKTTEEASKSTNMITEGETNEKGYSIICPSKLVKVVRTS